MNRGPSTTAAMSGELGALRWALHQRPDDKVAFVILIVMSVAGNRSFECWMSIKRIADTVKCHPRTVQRKIAHLVLRGYLEDISDRFPNRRTRTYRFGVN